MIATWFRSGRGLAVGTLVGALIVGKATPYLVHAFAEASVGLVVSTASVGAVLAAVMVAVAYRPGPYPFQRRPFSWRLAATVLRHHPTRLAIYGYLGHIWELYGMWTLIALFFTEAFRRAAATAPAAPAALAAASQWGDVAGFAAIAAGGAGAVLAGRWADRWGREEVASAAMVVSGVCASSVGWLMAAPGWLLVSLGLVWGFFVVADSAQFSTLVTEVAPAHAVGTALTLQTSLGYALTAFSIALTVQLVEAWGWGPAFSLLAVGPLFGITAMVRLRRLRGEPRPAPARRARVGG